MRIGEIEFEEPPLNRRQRHIASDEALFGVNIRGRAGHHCELGNCLSIENLNWIESNTCLCRACNDLNAEYGVTSQLEKVILDSNSLNAQHFGPNIYQYTFNFRAWRHVPVFGCSCTGLGQLLPIYFPARGERQLFQMHKE